MPQSKDKITPEAITTLRLEHPDYSLRQLAPGTGFSVEGLRQVLIDLRLPTKRAGYGSKYASKCSSCGGNCLSRKPPEGTGLCINCYRKQHPARMMSGNCTYCGKLVTRPYLNPKTLTSRGYRGRIFCNRACWGTWWQLNGSEVMRNAKAIKS